MGSLNNAHHESTGGVVIFNGELILLFCDSVHCEVDGRGSATGRIYLTTHRIVFTSTPITQNPELKSFSAPFVSMYDLDLQQPIFGANKIKGKVRSANAMNDPPFHFKLKFNKGGAIEFGSTMAQAAKSAATAAAAVNYNPMAPPPAYTPSPAEAYYQAPGSVYQPTYPVGFAIPSHMFNEPPPAGFVFASDAPPPYPGITNVGGVYGGPTTGFGQGYGTPGTQGYTYPPPGPQVNLPPENNQYHGYPASNPFGGGPAPSNNPYQQGPSPHNGQAPPNQNPYGQPPSNQNPYGQPPPTQNPYGQPPPTQNPYGQPGQGQVSVGNGAASAPVLGFSVLGSDTFEQPPSYNEASKKTQ